MSVGDRETSKGFHNMSFSLEPFNAPLWQPSVSQDGNKCLTNKVAVAHVESLYQKAADGGLSYATNDIARLHRKVAECERRIVQKEEEKKARITNGEKAKLLIYNPEEAKLSEAERVRKRREAEEVAQREAEREERRQRLLAIREELRRAREENLRSGYHLKEQK